MTELPVINTNESGTNGPGYLPMRAVTCQSAGLESRAIGGADRKITWVTFNLSKPVFPATLFFPR